MAGGRSGPGAGHAKDGVTAAAAGSYEAAEYARQYQAMVSYMQVSVGGRYRCKRFRVGAAVAGRG